jgi:hypothetical protein
MIRAAWAEKATATCEISRASALDLLSPFFRTTQEARAALASVREGNPLNWVRHSFVNRTVQRFSLCKAAGKGEFYKESVTNLYYHAQEWPTPIHKDSCSTVAMVAGGEDRIQYVIKSGKLKQWVGIGWVDVREATEQDYYTYPTVIKSSPGGAR